jgi:hypothetical protein
MAEDRFAIADIVLAFHRNDRNDFQVEVLKDRNGSLPVDYHGFLVEPGPRVTIREGHVWPWYDRSK